MKPKARGPETRGPGPAPRLKPGERELLIKTSEEMRKRLDQGISREQILRGCKLALEILRRHRHGRGDE